MEIEKGLRLQEIEIASNLLSTCPNCNSKKDFWLGMKGEHAYAQCKCCGSIFELCEVHKLGDKQQKQRWLRFLRK